MAHPLCDDGTPVIKSFSVVSPAELGHAPFGHAPGLVRHGLLTPKTQVQILSVVDATGSASIGDLIRALPGHPQPVTAVLALVASHILALEAKPVFDEHVLVRRKSVFDLPANAGPLGGTGAAAASRAITSLATGDFIPASSRSPGTRGGGRTAIPNWRVPAFTWRSAAPASTSA